MGDPNKLQPGQSPCPTSVQCQRLTVALFTVQSPLLTSIVSILFCLRASHSRADTPLADNKKRGYEECLKLLDVKEEPGKPAPGMAIFNIWRPLRGPVIDAPLALCDTSSLRPRDPVETSASSLCARHSRIHDG